MSFLLVRESHVRSAAWLVSFAGPIIGAIVVSVVVSWAYTRPVYVTASSTSGAYTTVFLAEGLLDDSPASVWAADHGPASLDFRLGGPRVVDSVTVRNSDNPPHRGPGSAGFHLELFLDEALVFDSDEGFANATDDHRVATHGVRADRIRVTIIQRAGSVPCIADVLWEAR